MCILFAYVNNEAKNGEYQIIIANNRDELYDRPTAPAARWNENSSCIGGIDLKPNVPPGGTWLGLSTNQRKIATLLHIVQPNNPDPTKKRRGCLVTNFLRSDVTAEQYLSDLQPREEDYNPFNLVLLEQKKNKWKVHYYSTSDSTSPYIISEKSFGISNSTFKAPWKKVQHGTSLFEEIVAKYGSSSNKEDLIQQLQELLSNRICHLPDPPLESTAFPTAISKEELNRGHACINVYLPALRYGSRTRTLILVEANGNGQYIESTMAEPVDAQNPKWNTTCIDFSMGETAS